MSYTLIRVCRALVAKRSLIAHTSFCFLLLLAPSPAQAISEEFHSLLGGIAHEISGRYQRVEDTTCRKHAWNNAITALVQASKIPAVPGPSPWTEDNETADLRMRMRSEGVAEQLGGECQMALDAVLRKDRSGKTGGVITGQVVMRCQCKRGTPDELKEAVVRFKVPVVLVQGPPAHMFQPVPNAEYSVAATCCSNEKHSTVWLPLLAGAPEYGFTPLNFERPTVTGEKAQLQTELDQTNSEIEETEAAIAKNAELIEYDKIVVREGEIAVKALENVNKGEFTLSNGERMKATSVSGGGIKVERINPDGSTTVVRKKATRKQLLDGRYGLEQSQQNLKEEREKGAQLDQQWETLLDKKAKLESDLDQAQAPSAEGKQVSQVGSTSAPSIGTVPGDTEAQVPTSAAYTPWEEEEWGVSLGVGYAEVETPTVDSGTLVTGTPGSERKGVESEENITDVSFKPTLTSPWGDLEFTYFDGDGTERASEPVGGLSVAFAYYQPAASGSLGLNTGPNGGVFRSKIGLTTYDFHYQPPFAFHESQTNNYYSEIRPTLFFENTDYCYWARTQSINLPGIFSETHQSVDEQRYGLGIRGTHEHRVTPRIVGRFVLDIDGYYRDSDLHSRQDNVCSAPGCPPANTFTARNDDGDSGFSWGVGVKAGLDYAFTENWALGMEVDYRYRHDTAALKNPTSTINFDRPPHLDTTGVNSWGIGVRLSYSFD